MGTKKKKIKAEEEKSEEENQDSLEKDKQEYQNTINQLVHPGVMNYQLLAKFQTIIDCLVHLVAQGKERNELLKDSDEEEEEEDETA